MAAGKLTVVQKGATLKVRLAPNGPGGGWELTDDEITSVVLPLLGLTSVELAVALPLLRVDYERAAGLTITLADDPRNDAAVSAWRAAGVSAETGTENRAAPGAAQPVDETTLAEVRDRVATVVRERRPDHPLTDDQTEALVAAVAASVGPFPAAWTQWGKWNVAADAAAVAELESIPIIYGPEPGPGPLSRGRRFAGSRFRAPKHYVPTPARKVADVSLGDVATTDPAAIAAAVGHHRAKPGRYSGEITVRFTVTGPTLLLDHERPVELQDALDLPTSHTGRTTAMYDGAPHLQPTTPKGLLRSLTRAVTDSRFQTLPSGPRDGRRIGYRMESQVANRLVPCRISQHADGTWHAELFAGTSTPGNRRGDEPMHAAWIPSHGRGRPIVEFLDAAGKRQRTTTGMTLVARIEPMIHRHLNDNREWTEGFHYWQVTQLALPGQPFALPAWTDPSLGGKHIENRNATARTVTGIVYATGETAEGKHDERLFFHVGTPVTKAVDAAVVADYELLLAEYHNGVVREGRRAARDYGPHIENHLTAATAPLAYALLDNGGPGAKVLSLHPVMLPRALHRTSMAATIHPTLKPPAAFTELSPADRLFGWAVDGAKHATGTGPAGLRGRVGVTSVETSLLSVTRFDKEDTISGWLPLDVQVSPKNSPRLSGSPNQSGVAHPSGDKPAERQQMAWGVGSNTPRGQAMWITPTGHDAGQAWWKPEVDNQAPWQRGPLDEGDRQSMVNTSIDSWVDGGSFDVTYRLNDLTAFELGALLWVLAPEEELDPPLTRNRPVRYRIGWGKSLGFGVVEPSLVASTVAPTVSLIAHYRSLRSTGPAPASPEELSACQVDFVAATRAAYPGVLEDFDQLRRGYTDQLNLAPPRAHAVRSAGDRLWYALNESRPPHRGGKQNLGPVRGNEGLEFFT